MKKHLPTIIIILIFAVGLSVLLYPTVSELVNSRSQTKAIARYEEESARLDTQEHARILEEAESYNSKLFSGELTARNAEEARDYYNSLLSAGSSMMGYMEIPVINVKLPIYHGTGEAVLQSGIGHLEGTSLPVGGENTHAALSGHRGLPSSTLLTNLNKVELGDIFVIHVLDRILTYEVDQIEVVEPSEVEALSIIPGGDYITLITCTPYGLNTHRLLVRGTRIENQEEIITETQTHRLTIDPYIIAAIGVSIALIALAIILLLVRRGKKDKKINEQVMEIRRRMDSRRQQEGVESEDEK